MRCIKSSPEMKVLATQEMDGRAYQNHFRDNQRHALLCRITSKDGLTDKMAITIYQVLEIKKP